MMKHDQTGFSDTSASAAVGQLSIRKLSVRLGGKAVLTNVSLEVATGEIVGLLGRDGAGKTTCFEAIAGLVRPCGGQAFLDRVDLTDLPCDWRARRGLSYLPESVSIFRGLTAEENILAALEVSEPDPERQACRLEALLADFELGTVRHQVATSLSGGERRRCELARAMALKPTILLLDEPFRGLDPTSVTSTKRVISDLKQHRVGVLVSDYDLHDLLEVTDRLYVLHEGQVIFEGSSAELLSCEAVRRNFLGDSFSL